MGFQWRDNLISLISSLGQFGRDPAASSTYALDYTLDRGQLEAAYRGNWIARKCVDIPADDATRMWRRWIAEDEDVTKLEQCEKQLHMRQRLRDVIKKSRLYGGAVLIMGIEGTGNFWDELDVNDVKQGALKFIHVVVRDMIIAGPIIRDLGNPWFGHPGWYQRMVGVVPDPATRVEPPPNYLGLQSGEQLDIHPSRVLRFTGLDYPDQEAAEDCWGDSVLQPVNSAIKAAGIVTQSVAGLTNKAAVDLIKIPDLGNKLSTTEGTAELFKRFSAAQDGKSVLNALLLDINEEWEQMTVSFGGLPQILEMYLSIAAGAVDIPATRFLSQSPKGLNATGESDQRNYYDRVKSDQEMRLTPAMTPLDEVLIRHALGSRDPEIDYEWKSLWMMNDHEKAELWWKKAQAHKIDVDAGLVPPDALRIARENQLIEDGTYPGLEQALDDCAQEDKDDIDEANLASITGGETHMFGGGPMTPEAQKQQLKMSTSLMPRPPPPGKPKTLGGGPAAGGPRRDANPFADVEDIGWTEEAREAALAVRQAHATAKAETSTPAFKAWFGNSKVVDNNKQPLMMYHGGRGEILGGIFDPAKRGEHLGGGGKEVQAFFFTSKPGVAQQYASHVPLPRGGEAITPVYLSVKNPLIVKAPYEVARSNPKLISESITKAKAAGKDGVIFYGIYDTPERYMGVEGQSTVVAAFEPQQIKSAIGNKGTFDPKSVDIRDIGWTEEAREAALAARRANAAGNLPMDHASRMARAKEQGFDTTTKWFHGSASSFEEFKPQHAAGVWLTTSPETAASYAGITGRYKEEGEQIYPLYIRGRMATNEDWNAAESSLHAPKNYTVHVAEELKRRGFDGFREGDIAAVFDPKNIRSVHAAFDPRSAESSHLLDIGWTEEAREAALEARRAHAAGNEEFAAGGEAPLSREQKAKLVRAYSRLARAERIAARKNRGKKGAKGGLKASGAALGYGEGPAFGSELAGDFNPYHVESGPEGGEFTSGPGEGSGSSESEKSVDYSNLRTMPTHIEGVSIIKKPLSGGQLAIGGSSGIAVSTSKRASAAWKDMKTYQKKAFDTGWMSSSHPNHTLWHELAHVKIKNETPPDHDSYLRNLNALSNPTFAKIAAKVSKYAGTNGHEFVAEVFAAKRAGRKLDDDVMAFYKHLKGPTP